MDNKEPVTMEEKDKVCNCTICQARALGVHPFQIYFGLDSLEARLVVEYPERPIYFYEEMAREERRKQSKDGN